MCRKMKPFVQPVIEPPKRINGFGKSFQAGCPDCGYKAFVEILDISMTRVVGLYCAGCDTQFDNMMLFFQTA